MLAAKERKVKDLQEINPELTEAEIKGKLIAYSSDQSNSSVEKAGLLGKYYTQFIQLILIKNIQYRVHENEIVTN